MKPKVIVNGREFDLVTEGDLDLGEAADVEEIVGQGYDIEKFGPRALTALIYISVRRVDPTVKLEDIRALKADDFEVKVEETEADPIPPLSSGESAGNASSGSESSPPGSDVHQAETLEPSGTPV